MKKLLIVLILGILGATAMGQNAFYNALKMHYLQANFDSLALDSFPGIKAIIEKIREDPYQINDLEADTIQAFLDSTLTVSAQGLITYDTTKWLALDTTLRVAGDQAAFGIGTASSLLSWESALIDGTAKFVAERFKEEVTRLYIDKFRARLGEIPYLCKLLPETHDFLDNADVFNYQELGNDFKDAFEQDLEDILPNLRELIETDTIIPKKLDIQLRNAFVFSLDLSDKLIHEYHPIEILDYLEQKYELKSTADSTYQGYYDLSKGLNILQLNLQRQKEISELANIEVPLAGLSNEDKYKDIWLPYESIKWLNTPEEVIYFSAFLYYQDRPFFERIFDKILDQQGTSIQRFDSAIDRKKGVIAENLYEELIDPIITLLNDIEKIQVKDQLNGDDYTAIIENFVGLLHTLEELNVSTWPDDFILFGEEGKELLEKIVDVYRSIYKKDYAYLVSSGSYVIATLLKDALKNENDTTKAKANVIQLLQAYKKYSSFMVDIVTTENSDDVKEVIKRHVTKFSYLDKRRSRFSATVTAQPGIVVGLERLSDTKNFKGNIGITAPIGFEFAWGHKNKEPLKLENSKLSRYEFVAGQQLKSFKGSYTSLMLTVLDIGAVFNYRLTDSDSALPQDITLKQVFAPGISLQHGFKNSPIVLGFGVQYTPELREVATPPISEAKNSFRIQARLTWDIPLVKLGAWREKKVGR